MFGDGCESPVTHDLVAWLNVAKRRDGVVVTKNKSRDGQTVPPGTRIETGAHHTFEKRRNIRPNFGTFFGFVVQTREVDRRVVALGESPLDERFEFLQVGTVDLDQGLHEEDHAFLTPDLIPIAAEHLAAEFDLGHGHGDYFLRSLVMSIACTD